MKDQTRWESVIPWFLTIACTITLAALAWFLIENILWFRTGAIQEADMQDVEYRLHIYHLHLSMIKRSVGLFSGFAIMFLGTGVAFYTMKKETKLGGEGKGITFSLVTASPGIIALAAGCALIISSVASKDEFPPYTGNKDKNALQVPLSEQAPPVPSSIFNDSSKNDHQ